MKSYHLDRKRDPMGSDFPRETKSSLLKKQLLLCIIIMSDIEAQCLVGETTYTVAVRNTAITLNFRFRGR
jgi:hypothetical protein